MQASRLTSLGPAAAFLKSRLVRNAASLYGSTVVTSSLGFVYWFAAARLAPPAAIGAASAVQSGAAFLSVVCVLGLSTLLISEISHDPSSARPLLVSSSAVVTSASLVIATAVAVPLRATGLVRGPQLGSSVFVAFIALSCLTALATLLDDACLGLFRADLQLRRNVVFSLGKLVILPVAVLLWPPASTTKLLVAWLLGLLFSLSLTAWPIWHATVPQPVRSSFSQLLDKRGQWASHHWLNITILSPRLLLPVVVATVVGTVANAGFTIALLIASVVGIIPTHFSTALFALRPGDEGALRGETKRTLSFCLLLAGVSGPLFFVLARPLLTLFGAQYRSSGMTLSYLGLTTAPLAVKAHFVAIARVRGHMGRAAKLTALGGGIEIIAAAAGGYLYGETGVALAVLLATVLEAAIFLPTVWKVVHAEPTF